MCRVDEFDTNQKGQQKGHGRRPVEQETVDRSADAEPELYTRVQVAGKDTALDRVTTRTDA